MKPDAYGVADPSQKATRNNQGKQQQDPLSGSKKVKNRNHSRNNGHGEGAGHGH
ncbi:small acid-soluble spore protein P [Paenibacillus aceris]|uniref:Small acid-soluble spore protein P (Minor) n=1 Tax=Paenibacillus aceris TaxID=869555 RepID=A0ABS4IA20_9BACL|nr:small acid-soluble spore protein P [Paenibacillus aceris]MBP1967787.1 small acid-soluble spore protein P (minor) [Paenibacillus aceris]NHW39064.1 small acid-soluble spore protein P [Paenibacillus aceris]